MVYPVHILSTISPSYIASKLCTPGTGINKHPRTSFRHAYFSYSFQSPSIQMPAHLPICLLPLASMYSKYLNSCTWPVINKADQLSYMGNYRKTAAVSIRSCLETENHLFRVCLRLVCAILTHHANISNATIQSDTSFRLLISHLNRYQQWWFIHGPCFTILFFTILYCWQ